MIKRKLEEIEQIEDNPYKRSRNIITLTGNKRKFQIDEIQAYKKPRRYPLDKLIAHYKGNISRNETARVTFQFYT